MGEFDESYDSGSVDNSSDSSFDTSEVGNLDASSEEPSSDTFEEDVSAAKSEAEYAEQQAESEAEYAEQQAESEAEYAEQQTESEACAEYDEQQVDESELSPAELYERGQQEARDAQDEAEQWADENNMDTWSDGTPRENYEGDSNDTSDMGEASVSEQQAEQDAEQQAEADAEYTEQQELQDEIERQAAERAELEAEVSERADALNKEYMGLMDRMQAAFDSTVNATNVEDRERYADEQYRIGQQMEEVRSKIIENNNRLK